MYRSVIASESDLICVVFRTVVSWCVRDIAFLIANVVLEVADLVGGSHIHDKYEVANRFRWEH